MAIESYQSKSGCGMGLCLVLEGYLQARKGGETIRVRDYPEICQDCIRANEEEREELREG